MRIVESSVTAMGNKQLLGIAQASEGLMIGIIASLWDDVPYSTAFVGDIPPTFDAQKDVCAATYTLLSTAIINLTAGYTASSDLFYVGNQLQWVAAIHSLKARFYLHTKNYAIALTETQQGVLDPANNMLANALLRRGKHVS